MAEIHAISMRHDYFADAPTPPASVRIPRPLRDMLAASRHGLTEGCRRAWASAAVAPGEWVGIDYDDLVGAIERHRIHSMRLRAQDGHLDLHMFFARGAHAAAIGRRVIVVAEPLPDTIATAAIDRPLAQLVDGPFLTDPAITIMKVIHRDGEPLVDVRCRCPSHLVHLITASDG